MTKGLAIKKKNKYASYIEEIAAVLGIDTTRYHTIEHLVVDIKQAIKLGRGIK